MATVYAWISREPSDRIDLFFTNVLLLLRALNHESLRKILNFEFPSDARYLQSASLMMPNSVQIKIFVFNCCQPERGCGRSSSDFLIILKSENNLYVADIW